MDPDQRRSLTPETNISDFLSSLLTTVSQGFFQPNTGGPNIPQAEGVLSDLVGDEPLFKALYNMFMENGGIFRLAFGPKCFLVVSDPVIVRHLLKDNAFNYDKGVLAEILKPIMGKGLIPADLETWKPRRRAVVPGFHMAYLDCMVHMFGRCTERAVSKFEKMTASSSTGEATVDMEVEFLNVALDIIGLGVFNYDFDSITSESPVIQAVYGVLREAEHRSTTYLPYWNLPLADRLVPRQVRFRKDITMINEVLDELIDQAKQTQVEADLEALQSRDYSKVKDPSLLRFLVDMRGEDASNQQLRDDLMTMLIAGHETTAAVLTWALHCLLDNPGELAKATEEVDRVIGDRMPTIADIKEMKQVRMVLSESLRLYPQPPILIRRALDEDVLPPGIGGDENGYKIGKGTDLFISVWNLHRSPLLWKDPDLFRPSRYEEDAPEGRGDWAGWSDMRETLYPSEKSTDFAYVPFGGGPRKCLGDQFALMEAVVMLSVLLRRFDFSRDESRGSPGMKTGATIHTADGLWMNVKKRARPAAPNPSESEKDLQKATMP